MTTDYSHDVIRPYQHLGHGNFAVALLILAVVYTFGEWAQKVSFIAFIAILLLIVGSPGTPRSFRTVAVIGAFTSGILSFTRLFTETPATIALDSLSTMAVVLITIATILRRLPYLAQVDTQAVMGAFLCYALIGFAAAYLYIGIDAVSAEPFFAQGQSPDGDFIYFALITLTTVGFGDLTAATELAKRLVVVQALTGQVFLVVLVARLVSLWRPPSRYTAATEE